MAEFNIRTDSVDVEQIMRQIRARIQEKRGVDYTEATDSGAGQRQARAVSRSERRALGSGRAVQAARAATSPRAAAITASRTRRCTRRTAAPSASSASCCSPILKMLLQPEPARAGAAPRRARSTHIYAQQFRAAREELRSPLYYEVIHNLVLELTRARHRDQEPEDAARVAVEPDGFRRAPRARARRRRAVPAGHGPVARAAVPPRPRAGPIAAHATARRQPEPAPQRPLRLPAADARASQAPAEATCDRGPGG